jgi:uncharacterized protein
MGKNCGFNDRRGIKFRLPRACAKALVRSALWDGSRQIDRSILPSYAQMLLEHVQGLTHEENERQSQIMAKRGLY